MNFYLGCAVWSYKGWIGNFYPSKSSPAKFLRLYSQRLTTVEGNTTFYAVPQPSTIKRWIDQTPPSFKFCPKFPKDITHQGLLHSSIPAAIEFLNRMSILENRLGVVFAQLPPSYGPDKIQDLHNFLTACKNNFPCSLAVEVRHLNWFHDDYANQLNDMLNQLDISRVLLDTRPLYESSDAPPVQSRPKPKVPLQPKITNQIGLIRFISHPQRENNVLFLREWVTQINNWLNQGKTIYFFVHCPVEEYSPETARYFQTLLKKQALNIPPLPWEQLEIPPQQLSLF